MRVGPGARKSVLDGSEIGVAMEQTADGGGKHRLDFGGDIGRLGSGFVAAFVVGGRGADVPGTVIAVSGHGDEEVGAHGFGGELVFDKQFAGQMQQVRFAEGEESEVVCLSGFTAPQPGQPRCEASRLRGIDPFLKVGCELCRGEM